MDGDVRVPDGVPTPLKGHGHAGEDATSFRLVNRRTQYFQALELAVAQVPD